MPPRNACKPETPNVALSRAPFASRLDMPDQITVGAVAQCELLFDVSVETPYSRSTCIHREKTSSRLLVPGASAVNLTVCVQY